MPSRIDRYRMKDGITLLGENYFNPIWVDVDQRLIALESARADYDAAILEIQGHGLAQITAALQPRLDEADVGLELLRDGLEALPSVASREYVDEEITGALEKHEKPDIDPHSQYMTAARHAAIPGNPHGTTALMVGAEPNLGNPPADGYVVSSSAAGARAWVPQGNPLLFIKADPASTCFIKTGAQTLALRAGTQVMIGTRLFTWAAQSAVVMPALSAGTDYAVYVCTDGTVRASSNWTAPEGYTVATSRLIGGFHYGLVAPGTTLAGGGFNTTGTPGTGSYIWTQSDLDALVGIHAYSLWDLKWRPACPSPKGMALVAGRLWVDLYLLCVDHHLYGTSGAGRGLAAHGTPPKIPSLFGGNGTVTYGSLTWFEAAEIGAAHGKRLLRHSEFLAAAAGVTVGTRAPSLPVTAARVNGLTSKWGLEQTTGALWAWAEALFATGNVGTWYFAESRGGIEPQAPLALRVGGSYGTEASACGPYCASFALSPGESAANTGARYCAEHVTLL